MNKLLIANRGEITCRIIESARRCGIPTVAVYSEADANARHVRMADEAVPIGPAASAESYLVIDKIIDAAKQTGANLIHPGYGFLAENATFAQACADADLIFMGPSPQAIELMGNKRAAKDKMIAAGVPCVPGWQGSQDDDELIAEAKKITMPVMVKAAAGGGGRGMRIVRNESDLPEAIRSARNEANSAFGNDELILEKAVEQARHVEIQVFGDRQGNIIHLGERDCSIQRRHQKIVEESPSPAVDDALRQKMGAAAVAAAQAVDYVGAGTVEFLLAPNGEFYFLEMNTRLQVEHPVTELVTGIDLVAWQISVALGEPLPMTQEQLSFHGHAIEVRLCAEDPLNDFMPQSGPVSRCEWPTTEGLRVDAAVDEGDEISPYYDSMQAKIIAWGESREQARIRLVLALEKTTVHGLSTNQEYLSEIIGGEVFADGDFSNEFVDQSGQPDALITPLSSLDTALAAVTIYMSDARELVGQQAVDWSMAGWRSAYAVPVPMKLTHRDEQFSLALNHLGDGEFAVVVDDEEMTIQVSRIDAQSMDYAINGSAQRCRYSRRAANLWVSRGARTLPWIDQTLAEPEKAKAGSDGNIQANSDGKILEVRVAVGDEVAADDILLVMEAMKMELRMTTPVAGTVTELMVSAGDQVSGRQSLVRIEPVVSEAADQ